MHKIRDIFHHSSDHQNHSIIADDNYALLISGPLSLLNRFEPTAIVHLIALNFLDVCSLISFDFSTSSFADMDHIVDVVDLADDCIGYDVHLTMELNRYHQHVRNHSL